MKPISTLIRPGFLVSPQAGGWGVGGGICLQDFLSFYGPIFHPNQSTHGLKKNLASSYTYKNFEEHPMNHNFSVRPSQNDLV